MKKVILFTLVIFLFSSLLSQSNSFVKNKLALIYEMSYSPHFNIINDGIYSHLPLMSQIKHTHKEHSIIANYKILSRISLSLTGGYMRNIIYSSRVSDSETDKELDRMSSVSFGSGINFYFKNGLAPSDSHIGLYVKQINYSATFKDSKQLVEYPNFQGYDDKYSDFIGDEAKMNMTFIGIKYNYTRMLFKKLPIFMNVGTSLFIPILIKSSFPEYNILIATSPDFQNSDFHSARIDQYGQDQATFQDYYKRLNTFKINLGIGYTF